MFAFSGVLVHTKESSVGETVHLQCEDNYTSNSSLIDWFYQPQLSAKPVRIVSSGHLINVDRGHRLTINGTTLTLKNINLIDRGIYTCVVHDIVYVHVRRKYRIRLVVNGNFLRHMRAFE